MTDGGSVCFIHRGISYEYLQIFWSRQLVTQERPTCPSIAPRVGDWRGRWSNVEGCCIFLLGAATLGTPVHALVD